MLRSYRVARPRRRAEAEWLALPDEDGATIRSGGRPRLRGGEGARGGGRRAPGHSRDQTAPHANFDDFDALTASLPWHSASSRGGRTRPPRSTSTCGHESAMADLAWLKARASTMASAGSRGQDDGRRDLRRFQMLGDSIDDRKASRGLAEGRRARTAARQHGV